MNGLYSIFRTLYSDYKSLGKREQIIIILILISFFALGSFGSMFFGKKDTLPTKTVSTPSESSALPTISATLSLFSDKKEVLKGETFTVIAILDSKDEGVDAADFDLTFDPQVLKVLSVKNGSFFKQYLRSESADGHVLISAVASLENELVVVPGGKGNVLQVEFQALDTPGTAFIKWNTDNTVVASKGQNILKSADNLTINIL